MIPLEIRTYLLFIYSGSVCLSSSLNPFGRYPWPNALAKSIHSASKTWNRGKPQKVDFFFNGSAIKEGKGVKAVPLRKKGLYFTYFPTEKFLLPLS